jgi:hypothetical protein
MECAAENIYKEWVNHNPQGLLLCLAFIFIAVGFRLCMLRGILADGM